MDFLEENKAALEESLYYRLADLLNLDVDLVFYDTTSLHFEIDEAGTVSQHGSQQAGGKAYPALRKRGKSKNGRDDAPQLVIRLAVTRDGFPVRHWVFPGNTVDLPTVKPVKAVIDKATIRAKERLDGKFVVHSNDDTPSAEDMALGYKQLQRAEEAWRTLKSGIGLRPVYHWTPHRVCAHVSLSVLALLLERVAEHACTDTWRNIRDDLKQIKLAQLLSPNGAVWQVTEPMPSAANRLKSLKIKNPAPTLDLV